MKKMKNAKRIGQIITIISGFFTGSIVFEVFRSLNSGSGAPKEEIGQILYYGFGLPAMAILIIVISLLIMLPSLIYWIVYLIIKYNKQKTENEEEYNANTFEIEEKG